MPSNFPDDENGDVLRRMERDGDDLEKLRDINSNVVLPSDAAATQFAGYARELDLKVSTEQSNCVSELPWDVTVTKYMIPTHTEITELEEALESIASPLGGHNDG